MLNKDYYCPYCNAKLEILAGWGSISYYCTVCNTLVSSKKILTKEQVDEKKNQE